MPVFKNDAQYLNWFATLSTTDQADSSNQTFELDPLVNERIFAEYTGTGTVTLPNATFQDAALDNAVFSSSYFSYSAGDYTYSGPDGQLFRIDYSLSINCIGNNRSTAISRLSLNGSQIDRSVAYSYHRNNADGETSPSKAIFLSLDNGDVMNLASALLLGTDADCQILKVNSNILFQKV